MPAGIEVVIDEGFASIDFIDRSLRGPALGRLVQSGCPIDVDSRSGPRKVYIVPEGNAREAGLVDDVPTLPPSPPPKAARAASVTK